MKILTINLCEYMPGHSRRERLDKVRQFIETSHVDVCLFQEGLDCCWPFYSSPRILRPMGYHLARHLCFGVGWFYLFEVGLVSRWPFLEVKYGNIEVPNAPWSVEDALDKLPLPNRTRAVAVTADVPGFPAGVRGVMSFTSVHLASNPASVGDQTEQFQNLAAFLKQFGGPMILGGDFNADLTAPGMAALSPLGLTPLGAGSQVDFIFGRGVSLVSSSLVLNDGTITDHAGGWLVEVQA